MRGLCNGLGPAMFGVIFYLFHVDLNDETRNLNVHNNNVDIKSIRNESLHNGYPNYTIEDEYAHLMPGPPFVFGALMVICAIAVAVFIPDGPSDNIRRPSGEKKSSYPYFLCFLFWFIFIIAFVYFSYITFFYPLLMEWSYAAKLKKKNIEYCMKILHTLELLCEWTVRYDNVDKY